MGLKSLVLITLVASVMIVSAESESLEDLLRLLLSKMDQKKADELLQTQKAKADLAGHTVLRGIVVGYDGQPVSSTGIDFALKLTEAEMAFIASVFALNRFDPRMTKEMYAEGVYYRMQGVPERDEANAMARNGQILHMEKVSFGVSAILIA